jgi:hypothetical protein
MERRKFIQTCCYTTVGASLCAGSLQSCGTALYFAETIKTGNTLTVRKSEFVLHKKDKTINRTYVFVKTAELDYPICLQKPARIATRRCSCLAHIKPAS